MLEDHSAPVVSVQMWFRVGSRNERPGIRGVSHLLEHLYYSGTDRIAPGDHLRILNRLGGSSSSTATSLDETHFINTVPAEHLAVVFELEADRMTHLKLDERYFRKELEVAKEEFRSNYQNNPKNALVLKMLETAFTAHPYSSTAIGRLEDLERLTLDDVKRHYRTYYAPNNAVLVVVGDTTAKAVKDAAARFFGPIARRPDPPPVDVVEPEQREHRRADLRMPTQRPIISCTYKIPEAASDDAFALEVAAKVLARGKSSRLYRRLVLEDKIAVSESVSFEGTYDPSLFWVSASIKPGRSADEVEKAIEEEIGRLAAEGPTADELAKAKKQVVAGYIFGLDEVRGIGMEIGRAETKARDYRRFAEGTRRTEAVTAEDVKRVARTYLVHERLTTSALVPPGPGEEAPRKVPPHEDEAEQELPTWPTEARFLDPAPPKPAPMPLPPITRTTLDNGMKLMIIEHREQPVAYMKLLVPGGALTEPPGKAGVAELMADMLTRGTPTRTAEQISEEIDGLGGALGADSDWEKTQVSARFLSSDFGQGLELFADVALHPAFPAAEMDGALSSAEGGLRSAKDNPTALALLHAEYLVFGYEHPFGRPASLDTLANVTLDDVKSAYRTAFRPKGAILAVAGDVDPAAVEAAVAKLFGSWSAEGPTFALPADPPLPSGRAVRFVDKPDLTQSTIAVAQLGVNRLDPDAIPLQLGNFALGGGGFSSRLVIAARAQGGKTYKVWSRFADGRLRGIFAAGMSTRSRETGAMLRLVLGEIEKIVAGGITAEELRAGQNFWAGSYAIRLQSPAEIADDLLRAEYLGLGEAWVRDYRKNVLAATLEDVNAALRRHLDPSKLAVVVVGNAAEALEQAKEFGAPVVLDYLATVPDEERAAGKGRKEKKPLKKR